MKKPPKEKDKKHHEAWKEQEEKMESPSLHADVERKQEEIKNSTIGGF